VLRADGARIDLTKRDTGKLLAATKQSWQETSYQYRDLIGELRYAVRLLARSVARARFYPAATRPWPADPAPLADDDHELNAQLAADAVTNFDRLPMDSNPDGFTARLVENLALAGEAWPHLDADDRWWVRSVSEITAGTDGRVSLAAAPGAPSHTARLVDPNNEDLLRIWVPHPQWGQLADSPMRSLLDVAEDVVLAGREQRAAARSRLAANGVLFIPDTMTLARTRDEDDDDTYDDSIASDSFMADFEAAVVASVMDDGAPQMVVPIVIRGDRDDIAAVKHVTFERSDSEQLIARQGSAILRLLKGLDIQPEQVEGLGSSNHWSAWLIESQSVRHQVQPMAETVAHGLAAAYLRPALLALGHPADEVAKVTIGVDVTPLTDNPNRGQDARDAHAAAVISDDALRRELGFDDDDKPTDDEVIRRLAINGRLSQETTEMILGLSRPGTRREQITVQGETVPTGLPEGGERPAAQPGQLHPERTTPAAPTKEQPPGPVVAAALPADDWVVDEQAARRLTDIDAALTERVLVAADAALQRVAERAGAKVRSAARNNKTITASLAGVDAHLIPATLGRERVESLTSIPDLITDSYTRLRAQLDGWLVDAADQTADTVCAILGLDPKRGRGRDVRAQVRNRLAATRDRAWPILAEALDAAAEDALFPEPAQENPGETSDALIDPLDIVDALAAAGGAIGAVTAAGSGYGGRGRTGRARRKRRDPRPALNTVLPATPAGGLATGPVVHDIITDNGGVLLGWQWDYRPELARTVFDPHKQLDGARFLSWRDPILATSPATAWIGTHFHPRDHAGCLCTGTPLFAAVADPESALAQAIRDAHGQPDAILVGGTPGQGGSTGGLRDRARAAVDDMRANLVRRKGRR
jgi:hypothetical protein